VCNDSQGGGGQKSGIFFKKIPCNDSGSIYLSGGVAYHWYFNPDIPEAETYYNRYILSVTSIVLFLKKEKHNHYV
jgi:hypothetical protein